MFPLPEFILMMRISRTLPRYRSRSRTGRTSICDADVHREAALHLGRHPSLNGRPLLVGNVQVVPGLQLLRLLAGEDDVAAAVLGLLEVDLELFAGSERGQFLGRELVSGNDPVRLVPEVHQYRRRLDAQYPRLDDRAFLEALERLIVQPLELALFLVLVIVLELDIGAAHAHETAFPRETAACSRLFLFIILLIAAVQRLRQ